MRIAIIAAMEPEVTYYLNHLDIIAKHQVAHVEWWEARVLDHEVIIARSGIGKVNAAIATTVIAQLKPDILINSGSAGAVNPQRQVGDIVVSDGAMYHDVDATAFDYAPGQVPRMPVQYPSDATWREKVVHIYEQMNKTVVNGLVLTSDSFIASASKVAELAQAFPEAQCTEMEGAAIAQTAYQFRIPSLIVRAVSDTASQDANVLFDQFIEQAGLDSAQATLTLIEQIGA